jgi:parvulin-like peptidyl-prolyl isomerase
MSFRIRRNIALPLLALIAVLALAACGGGSSSADVPEGAIAVVGEKTITKEQFDAFMEQQKKVAESKKQDFPAAGTPEYQAVKDNVVKTLVERQEWELEAEAMGIKVTDQEIETQLNQQKEQYGLTDEQKYQAELAKAGITDAQVRDQVRIDILTNKLAEAVTKNVAVTDADVKAYYDRNKSTYEQPESREVRHILVKTKAQAQKLHDQIENGADFAALAKKYTQDTASKAAGGKFTAFKGRTVQPFDDFVFSAKTGELSDPIKTEFGWHLIETLGPIKPGTTRPLDEVKAEIQTKLLQTKKNAAIQAWVAGLPKKYEDQISYAPGYAPAASATDTGTTTGTG